MAQQSQFITLRYWFVEVWQKQRVESINKLAALMAKNGFNVNRLDEYLDTHQVSTLKEWWELMGKYLYKTKEAFAKSLGIPVSTLKDYILHPTVLPQFKEYHRKLYLATALPIYAQYGLKEQTDSLPLVSTGAAEIEDFLSTAESIVFARKLGALSIHAISKLLKTNLSFTDKQRLLALVHEMTDRLQIAERILNGEGDEARLNIQLSKLFGNE